MPVVEVPDKDRRCRSSHRRRNRGTVRSPAEAPTEERGGPRARVHHIPECWRAGRPPMSVLPVAVVIADGHVPICPPIGRTPGPGASSSRRTRAGVEAEKNRNVGPYRRPVRSSPGTRGTFVTEPHWKNAAFRCSSTRTLTRPRWRAGRPRCQSCVAVVIPQARYVPTNPPLGKTRRSGARVPCTRCRSTGENGFVDLNAALGRRGPSVTGPYGARRSSLRLVASSPGYPRNPPAMGAQSTELAHQPHASQ